MVLMEIVAASESLLITVSTVNQEPLQPSSTLQKKNVPFPDSNMYFLHIKFLKKLSQRD